MNKKLVSLIFFASLLVSGYVPIATAHNAPFPGGYDPTHAIVDTIGEPESVDPAWGYDTASTEVILQVNEPLISFAVNYIDGPYAAGKVDLFRPQLATDISIKTGPTGYVKTFYFRIRGLSGTHTVERVGGIPLPPAGTDWHEVTPWTSTNWRLEEWIDNGDEVVNTGDQLKMSRDANNLNAQYWRVYQHFHIDYIRGPEKHAENVAVNNLFNPGGEAIYKDLDADGKVSVGDILVEGSAQGVGTQLIDFSGIVPERHAENIATNDILDAGETIYQDVGPVSFAVDIGDILVQGPAQPIGSPLKSFVTAPETQMHITEKPVLFHNSAVLSAEDVEYSFERAFVQDRSGGPTWMLWYPTQGLYYAMSPEEDPNFGAVIDDMVGANATHAWISLKTDFPETTFLQILSQSWSSILNKDWCIAEGDFDGNWAAGWETIWNTWHDPSVSFLEDPAPVMMGTGPYRFEYWEQGTAWSVLRFTDYWGGWPAQVEWPTHLTPTPVGESRIGGYVERVTWNLLPDWTTRRARFLAGDSDFTYVPRMYRDQVLGQYVGGEPIRCYYPVEPMLALDAFFFNFDINPQSPYLGPGFDPANPYVIAADRIPVNLFADIHVRNGFAAAFDYALFLSAAYLGEAVQPSDPIIPGLSYDNPAQSKPVFNLATATVELMLAWGGALWSNGMTFTILYNSGNVGREVAATILANNINGLNPLFNVHVQEVAWGSTYLPQMVAGMLPLFINGWSADFTDPYDFAYPFMHTYGTFSQCQSYSNPRVDELIEAGTLMPQDTNPYGGELDFPDPRPYFNNPGGIPPDTRWPRRSIYYELQAIYVEDVPSIPIAQPIGRHWEQPWIRGWYYNPICGGTLAEAIDSTAPEAPALYFYHIWKAKTHFGDANNDGVVNVVDAAVISACWTKPAPTSPLGPLGYNPKADLSGGSGGTPDGGTGLIVGIPDGKVTVVDMAVVSAYWDGPPQGPSHP